MEVHAPPHTPRKKWTHYLWEFLMLFLAVFCGFLAENFREHQIEKERGKQYIYMYYEDLRTDTVNFAKLLTIYENKISNLEKRLDCFDELSKDRSATECLWNLIITSSYFPDLVYTDRTLQQLKNSGGLRLLKRADADSILLYDNDLSHYKNFETTSFQEIQTGIRNTVFSLINYKKLFEKRGENIPGNTHYLLYPGTDELLNRYFMQLESYTITGKKIFETIASLKTRAASLINYFKKEYHLK